MARGKFDPSKMAAAKKADDQAAPLPTGGSLFGPVKGTVAQASASAASGASKDMSVLQLASLIASALETATPKSVRVIGQVSNFTDRTHWYFALKDAEAVINCVMFAGKSRSGSAGYVPQVGHEVVVTARLDFFKPQGKVTLIVDRIEPVGAGVLEIAFRKLCEELRALGWFAPERKRELPVFPRRVAVVTSRTGAALQDVLDTMRRRCPAVEVMLIDTLVQGAAAAPSVVRAVNWVSASAKRLGIDALLVTRGGGSMEDLWAFNERVVAEAIVACSIPVVAAIGHETDTTIAELVADLRAATPTQAAMHLTPDRAALLEQLALTESRLVNLVRRGPAERRKMLLASARQLFSAQRSANQSRHRQLDALSARLERFRPQSVYQQRRARLESLAADLTRGVRSIIDREPIERLTRELSLAAVRTGERRALELSALQRQLDLVGPVAVLKRGYSVTLTASGQVLRSAGSARAGEKLVTRLSDGEVRSTVEGAGGQALPAPSAMPAARRTFAKRKRTDDATPGLFG